jgi:N-acyl-L-homoserine lactone synthetase
MPHLLSPLEAPGPPPTRGPTREVRFAEGLLTVRPITAPDDLAEAYRLRHRVFCTRLGWVPSSPEGLETDRYDAWAHHLGVYTESVGLAALVRVLPADCPFMLESDFLGLVGPDHRIRKQPDTAEISRLALADDDRPPRRVAMLLYKGLYQWSLANAVRYLYMEVEPRYWRALTLTGFPCRPIGPIRRWPPANVESVALLLDWEEFRLANRGRRDDWLAWMATRGSAPVP